MQQENEELEKGCQDRMEERDLLTKNAVMSQTISEQSRQQEHCQQHETKRGQRKEQLMKEDYLEKYYVPQLECIVEENKRLQYELNESSRSSKKFDPASPPTASSLSSPSGVRSDEDEERLDKLLNVCENFGIECTDKLLKRKIQVLKGYIICDQAKIRRILDEARRTAKKHLSVLQAQEDELKSTKRELKILKKLFNDVIKKEKSKYKAQAAEWQLKLRNASVSCLNQEQKIYDLHWENRTLRNSNRTAEKINNCSDSVEAISGDDTTRLASDSSNPIKDDGDEDAATSNLALIVTSGDVTDTDESTAALINTGTNTGEVADTAESIKTPNATRFSSEGVCTKKSKTSTYSNASPYLRTALKKSANNLHSINTKRKGNQTDVEKASKKIKSSIEPASREDESDREIEAKRRTLKLEGEVLQLNNQLRGVAAYHMKLQHAFKERNIEMKDMLKDQEDFIPYNWLNRVAQQTAARRHHPAIPITQKDARAFSEDVSFLNATFSMQHYRIAAMNPRFLLYYPIGMVNSGGTFCYLNSVVQALSNLPRFAVSAVCSLDHEEGSLLHALFELYKYCWVRRPNTQLRPNSTILHANEIRSFYSKNRSVHFDPALQHDADEFLVDLIRTLEAEVSEQDPGTEENNFIKHLFCGYICSPNGTRESFRTLRLSIVDERIDSVEKALLYHLVYKPPRSTRPEPPTMPTLLNSVSSSPMESKITKQSSNNVSSQGAEDEKFPCFPSSGMDRASEFPSDELKVVPESYDETRKYGVSKEIHSPGISQSIDCSLLSDSPNQKPTSDDTRNRKVNGRDEISAIVQKLPSNCATTHQAKSGSEDVFRTIEIEYNKSQRFETERIMIGSEPLDETVNDPNKSKENIDSNFTTVDHEENLTFHENTSISDQFEVNQKIIPENTSQIETTPIFRIPELPLRFAKPKLKTNANRSTLPGTDDCDARRKADSLLEKMNSITEKYCKIYAAEILCVTLDRHNSDNSFNSKIIPADDLAIPPHLRSPEGATCPALYKLMSIIQYVHMGPTSGHYYTYVKAGRNSGYMLNDSNVSRVENEAFDLTAFGGRSSIFVYIKRPNFLPPLPYSD